ncbi:uncharacterized protein LOC112568005 [Pomacea canaliculata]|uniref:uncharacterized protein LOC112568005 n=1 Tax=Pomacea canaliculata TaxID=400727 RepID=UPI000D734BE8|nr:uncharacterized protein LOC112568005 [Pomacea canaliculata]
MLPSYHRHYSRSKTSKTVLRINYCLMFVCLTVVFIYVMTLLYLHKVFRWPALDSFRQALQSDGTERDFPFCVQKSMWTDKDRFSLEKEFEYRMKRDSKGERMICFNSLDWIPVVIEKRSEQLLARLPRDDDQVQNLTDSARRLSKNDAKVFQPGSSLKLFADSESSSISSSGQDSFPTRLLHPMVYLCARDNNQQTASTFVKWTAPDGETTYLKSVQLNGREMR